MFFGCTYTHLVETFLIAVTLAMWKKKGKRYFTTENKDWKNLYRATRSDCIINL